jgi:zinc/manganese transport system substrate-binding protein
MAGKLRSVIAIAIAAGIAFAIHAAPARAALNVFACEPEWAALATELGGDRVSAFSATTGRQDPHQVQARPTLIAKLRNADLAGTPDPTISSARGQVSRW